MAEVFVCGALHLDVIVDAPALPRPDETVVGRSVAYRFGGKGGNQAVAAARMGAAVAMAGRVGDDQFAAQILAELDAAGVNRRAVLAGPGASGMSVAIVEATGDYGAVIVSGVNREIRPEDALSPPGAQVILLQSEIDEAVNLAVARAAQGAQVILNAAPARPVSPVLLALTDLLIVNRVEAAALTGRGADALDPEAAAEELLDLGPAAVMVTLGGDGLVCRRADGVGFAASAHRVGVISTHGAGDAFVGALAARFAAGDGPEQAAAFAQAAAALHVSTPVDRRAEIGPRAVRAFIRS